MAYSEEFTHITENKDRVNIEMSILYKYLYLYKC